jgi:hypothetical protein
MDRTEAPIKVKGGSTLVELKRGSWVRDDGGWVTSGLQRDDDAPLMDVQLIGGRWARVRGRNAVVKTTGDNTLIFTQRGTEVALMSNLDFDYPPGRTNGPHIQVLSETDRPLRAYEMVWRAAEEHDVFGESLDDVIAKTRRRSLALTR